MASPATRRSPRTSVRSLASMAASVPWPIARPRSAWASAAASLTPSPTIATTRPSSCRCLTTSTLSAGSTSAITSSAVDADRRRRRARRPGRLSPVSSTGRSPRSRSSATAAALVGLTVSATTNTPRDLAVPADEHGGLPGGLGCLHRRRRARVRVHRPVGEEARAAGDDGVAVDDAGDAETLRVGEALDRQQVDAVRRAGGDGPADRVLGGVLE